MEHTVCLKALFGSHNYNLNDEDSDKDYKLFVLPTFDDLYGGQHFTKQSTSDSEDYSIHDIRKIPDLFWKANINFLEMLYSKDVQVHKDLSFLFEERQTWSLMNIPCLISSCEGMFFEKLKHLEKGTSTTQIFVERFGYDTKQLLHAYRCLDFMIRLFQFDLNFSHALYYTDEDKNFMMSMKKGRYSLDDARTILSKQHSLFGEFKAIAKNSFTKDESSYEQLKSMIKEFVRNNISLNS